MLTLVSMALAASGPDPSRVAEVSKAAPPVDWTVVLDSSAEMLDVAKAARADVAALTQALPAGDSIEILAFHTRGTKVLDRTELREADRAALVERIRTIEVETARDADLGAGLELVASTLGESETTHAHALIVLSRFCHAPSVASQYDTGVRGCRPIRGHSGLVTDLAGVFAKRDAATWLFPVASTGGAPDAAGLNAAKEALQAQVVTEQTLSAWIGALVPRIGVERLRPVLAADVKRAALALSVANPGTPDAPEATLTVQAPVRVLQINLRDARLEGATRSDSGVITVAPKAEVKASLPQPGVPFALFEQQDVVSYDVALSGEATYEPADVLIDLGLSKSAGPWSGKTRIDMPRSYGLPSPLGALILLGAAVAAVGGVVAWRLKSLSRELGGSFYWRVGNGARTELEIGHLASAGIVVAADHIAVGPEAQAALVFRMTGPRWRSVAEVEVKRDGVEMNRRPLARGVHPVTPGAASFQFDGFRLTWE